MGINAKHALTILRLTGSDDSVLLKQQLESALSADEYARMDRITVTFSNAFDQPLSIGQFGEQIYFDGVLTSQITLCGFRYANGDRFQIEGKQNIEATGYTAGADGYLDVLVESDAPEGGAGVNSPFTAYRYAQSTMNAPLTPLTLSGMGFSAFERSVADKAVIGAITGDVRLAWSASGTVSGTVGLLLKAGKSITVHGNDNINALQFFPDADGTAIVAVQLETTINPT